VKQATPATRNVGGNLNGNAAGNLNGRNFGGQQFGNQQQLQGMLQQQAGARNGNWQQQFSQSNLSDRAGQAPQNYQQQLTNFQNGPQPFTPQWYAQHSQAWQNTHPHADAWAAASVTAAAAWLGTAYYPPTGSGGSSTTVIYEEAPAEPTLAEQSDAALANVAADPSAIDQSQWLALGVYTVATTPQVAPTLMLQLAVDHGGNLRGVHYDGLTNSTHNLTGQVDRNTRRAAWSLESNPDAQFQAPLDVLLQPSGTVEVNLPTGAQRWNLTRIETQSP
jgi:hypothetical protein